MIKSQEIDKYIHDLLVKPYTDHLTKEDLNQVKKLILNKYNIKNEVVEYDYSDLKKLTNLERCSIEFLDITNEFIENINAIDSIKSLEISRCKMNYNLKLKNNLENIILSYMSEEILNLFDNSMNVETVELIGFETINLENLLKFKNLKQLSIYNSNIINFELINEFSNLQFLNLDGSQLDDESFLEKVNKNIIIQRRDKFLLADAY